MSKKNSKSKVSPKTAYSVVHSTVKSAEECAQAVFGKGNDWTKHCKVVPSEGGGFQLVPIKGKGSRKAVVDAKSLDKMSKQVVEEKAFKEKVKKFRNSAQTSATEDEAVRVGNVVLAEGGSPVAKLNKSIIDRPVEYMWNLCDEMKGARRKDVIIKAMEAGVAFYTARTQYQLWKKAGAAK